MNTGFWIRKLCWLILFSLTSAIFCQQSFALSCRQGSNASSKTPVGTTLAPFPINSVAFAKSDFVAGRVLWRSETFTSTFTCWDTDNHPEGEDAYIYWNPWGDLSNIDPSLSIGVTINGKDYDTVNTQYRVRAIDVGAGTGPGTYRSCTSTSIFGICLAYKNVALPNTTSFSFSIYIKATGKTPPTSYANLATARVFQVDGVLGINTSTQNSNYVANLTNFNNIRVIQCTPTVTIVGTGNNTVAFGNIPATNASVGKIERTVPFTVNANIAGGGCSGESLVISFSSPDVSSTDNTLLIPATKPGLGIFITPQDNTSSKITFGQISDFTSSAITKDTTVISKAYNANLQWLTASPSVGSFSSTATVNVTFK